MNWLPTPAKVTLVFLPLASLIANAAAMIFELELIPCHVSQFRHSYCYQMHGLASSPGWTKGEGYIILCHVPLWYENGSANFISLSAVLISLIQSNAQISLRHGCLNLASVSSHELITATILFSSLKVLLSCSSFNTSSGTLGSSCCPRSFHLPAMLLIYWRTFFPLSCRVTAV